MGASYSIYLKPFVAGFVAYATYRWLSGNSAPDNDKKDDPDALADNDKKNIIKSMNTKMIESKAEEVVDQKIAEDCVSEKVESKTAEVVTTEVLDDEKITNSVIPEAKDNAEVVDEKKITEPSIVASIVDTKNIAEVSVDSKKNTADVVAEEKKPEAPVVDPLEQQKKAVRAMILPTTGRAVEEIPMSDTVTSARSWIYDTPWAPTEPLTGGDRAILFADDEGVEPAHHMGPSLYGAPYSGGRRDVYR